MKYAELHKQVFLGSEKANSRLSFQGKKSNSPLEKIKGIQTNVTMSDILDSIRESRERN